MLWFLIIVALAVVMFFAWKSSEPTPALKIKAGAKEALDSAKAELEKVADVNKDGKVDFQDAVAAAQNVKKEVVKDVAIVKEEVKKVKKKYGGKVKKSAPTP